MNCALQVYTSQKGADNAQRFLASHGVNLKAFKCSRCGKFHLERNGELKYAPMPKLQLPVKRPKDAPANKAILPQRQARVPGRHTGAHKKAAGDLPQRRRRSGLVR